MYYEKGPLKGKVVINVLEEKKKTFIKILRKN